jgi:hypothetical protein
VVVRLHSRVGAATRMVLRKYTSRRQNELEEWGSGLK